jgi:hypothetical protein
MRAAAPPPCVFRGPRSNVDGGDDPERIGIHNDQFFIHDEVAATAPLRVNIDDHLRNIDDVHRPWTGVPTLSEKSTLLTRGAVFSLNTVSRIFVRCSGVNETETLPDR